MNGHPDHVRLYRYRWVVLLAFMFINVTIQALWICFAPVTGKAAGFYHVSELRVGFLAMVFMVVYVPVSLPASWAIDRFGFRNAVGVGAVLLAVFGLLRAFCGANFSLTLLATVGIAIAQPLLLNASTKVGALWFGREERATAVGLVTVASFLGIVLGEVLSPSLVSAFGFAGMQLVWGGAAAASSVVFLLLAREHPRTPPGPAGSEDRALMLAGLKHIFRQHDFYYLAGGIIVGGGLFNGLTTWVEAIARPKGFSSTQAGALAALMLIGAIVGAALFPVVSDRLKRRKPVLLFGVMASVPALTVLTFAGSYPLLLGAFFSLGCFLIGIAPVMYQYGAEITYPAPEGTSNGLFMLAMQLSVVFIYAMGWLNQAFGSFTPSLVLFVFLLVAVCGLFIRLEESPLVTPARAPAHP